MLQIIDYNLNGNQWEAEAAMEWVFPHFMKNVTVEERISSKVSRYIKKKNHKKT